MFRWTILTAAALASLTLTGTAQANHWRELRVVESFYPRYLGREAFVGEIRHWRCQLDDGLTISEIEVQILGGPEFYARCGSTREGYVAGLYGTVVGTPAGPRDFNYWMSRYPSCGCRKKLARAVLAWARPTPPPVVVTPVPVGPGHVPAYPPVPVVVPVPHPHHHHHPRPSISVRVTLPIR